MIVVNAPILIEGKTCILVRDVLGAAPTDKYTSQEQGSLLVWYEEEALRETREANPDTPVYGFWQTLIASGLIDTSKQLQYIFTAQDRDFGYYLYSREDFLHTGSVFQDELQRLPEPAIQDGITIADGEEITVDATHLKLPDSPLRTHRERIQSAAERKKKSQQQAFLAIAFIGGIGLLADTGLSFHHDAHMDAYTKTSSELHIAEQALTDIKRQKLVTWPDQKQSMANLYQVSNLLGRATLAGEISLVPNKTASVSATDIPFAEAKLVMLKEMGLEIVRESASKTKIQWVNHETR